MAAWCSPPPGPGAGWHRSRWSHNLSVETNASESVFHLSIGVRRPVEVVRAADNFYIEVDQQGGLAGFWMTNVPPFSSFEEA